MNESGSGSGHYLKPPSKPGTERKSLPLAEIGLKLPAIFGQSRGSQCKGNDPSVNMGKHRPATIGLLTSESPDSVAAWRGRKRSQPYGKPILACDRTARVLVLGEPVYMMWPKLMKMVTGPEVTSSPADSSDVENCEGEASLDGVTVVHQNRRQSMQRLRLAAEGTGPGGWGGSRIRLLERKGRERERET